MSIKDGVIELTVVKVATCDDKYLHNKAAQRRLFLKNQGIFFLSVLTGIARQDCLCFFWIYSHSKGSPKSCQVLFMAGFVFLTKQPFLIKYSS